MYSTIQSSARTILGEHMYSPRAMLGWISLSMGLAIGLIVYKIIIHLSYLNSFGLGN